MKKIVLIVFALAALATVNAQGTGNNSNIQVVQQPDTAQFMRECRQFSFYVLNAPINKVVLDSLSICQDTLMAHYRTIKPQLTDKQVEEYNRAKGRYARRVIEYRGEKVGEGLKATGDSIAKAAGRVGNAIGGYFKGIFGR
jgi:hypothetical protein